MDSLFIFIYRFRAFLIVIIIAVTAVILSLSGGHVTYEVRRVIDGDTIILSNGARVRYIGIDTPELRDKRPVVRGLAEKAAYANARLVTGKKIRLDYDVERFDRYDRVLAYVYADGVFVNARLVKDGYAKVYTYPPNVTHADEFRALEQQARDQGRGLWEYKEFTGL